VEVGPSEAIGPYSQVVTWAVEQERYARQEYRCAKSQPAWASRANTGESPPGLARRQRAARGSAGSEIERLALEGEGGPWLGPSVRRRLLHRRVGSEVAVARPVRAAASLAVDRATINQALTLGFSRVTGGIIPDNFEFFWRPPRSRPREEGERETELRMAGQNGMVLIQREGVQRGKRL
jgi:hypothetical protein